LTQTIDAFGEVQGSLSWFVQSYRLIAEWKASVDRLISFDQAIAAAEETGQGGIALTPATGAGVSIEGIDLRLPNGEPLIPAATAKIAAGEHVLISGRSGSGKSTFFRAIAGIWPYGAGKIVIPRLARMLFLPQRPYVPI